MSHHLHSLLTPEALFTAAEWSALKDALDLSPREREILEVMCEGIKDIVIAERLSMAKDTLRSHITRLHRKLGVRNRTQLLVALFNAHLGLLRLKRTVRNAPVIEMPRRR